MSRQHRHRLGLLLLWSAVCFMVAAWLLWASAPPLIVAVVLVLLIAAALLTWRQ